jgi:hypothetical protein
MKNYVTLLLELLLWLRVSLQVNHSLQVGSFTQGSLGVPIAATLDISRLFGSYGWSTPIALGVNGALITLCVIAL